MPKKRESALSKCRRYNEEKQQGAYVVNGKIVCMNETRDAYIDGYNEMVQKQLVADNPESDKLFKSYMAGVNAAVKDLAREKKAKKRKENKKIIDNAKAKEKKKKAKEKKAKEKVINDYKAKEEKKNNSSPKPGNGKGVWNGETL